jgi:hypothetical protein
VVVEGFGKGEREKLLVKLVYLGGAPEAHSKIPNDRDCLARSAGAPSSSDKHLITQIEEEAADHREELHKTKKG